MTTNQPNDPTERPEQPTLEQPTLEPPTTSPGATPAGEPHILSQPVRDGATRPQPYASEPYASEPPVSVPPVGSTPGAATAEPARGGLRQGAWVAIVVTVIGAIAVAGTVVPSLMNGLGAHWWGPSVGVSWGDRGPGFDPGPGSGYDDANRRVTSTAVDVAGVTAVDLVGRAAVVSVTYDDVEQATLEVRSDRSDVVDWTFEVVGSTLQIGAPGNAGTEFDWNDRTEAFVVLPESLQDARVDLSATVASGALELDGDFGAVDLDIDSGGATLDGDAESLTVSAQSGAIDLNTEVPGAVDITLGSGILSGELSGEQPASIRLHVASGFATLTVPEGAYRVSGEAQSGERDLNVEQSPTAASTLVVPVQSGVVSIDQ